LTRIILDGISSDLCFDVQCDECSYNAGASSKVKLQSLEDESNEQVAPRCNEAALMI
jgi:hypothetical protein